jgi:hypothetical protein
MKTLQTLQTVFLRNLTTEDGMAKPKPKTSDEKFERNEQSRQDSLEKTLIRQHHKEERKGKMSHDVKSERTFYCSECKKTCLNEPCKCTYEYQWCGGNGTCIQNTKPYQCEYHFAEEQGAKGREYNSDYYYDKLSLFHCHS